MSKYKPLYDIENPPLNLYRSVSMVMTGWKGFCSGGLLTNITSPHNYSENAFDDKNRKLVIEQIPPEYLISNCLVGQVPTLQTFWKLTRKAGIRGTHYMVTTPILYATLLERLWDKSFKGVGGDNMWAGNTYASKTWGLADKDRRGPDEICCGNFGKWLERKNVATTYFIRTAPVFVR